MADRRRPASPLAEDTPPVKRSRANPEHGQELSPRERVRGDATLGNHPSPGNSERDVKPSHSAGEPEPSATEGWGNQSKYTFAAHPRLPPHAFTQANEEPAERDRIFRGVTTAVTEDSRYVVKGLNVGWIPEPLLGKMKLNVLDNGRFGPADPLERPQTFSEAHPHLAFIPHRPPREHPAKILWSTPTEDQLETTSEGFGRLKGGVICSLERALATLDEPIKRMRDALDKQPDFERSTTLRRLEARMDMALAVFNTPSTYKDCVSLWGHLHRCYAELWAWLGWLQRDVRDADPTGGIDSGGVMGALTSDPVVALTLRSWGVPTWYLVLRRNALEGGRLIKTSKADWGHPPYLRSVPGEFAVGRPQLEAIARWSSKVVDIETVPIPNHYEITEEPSRAPSGSKATTGKRSSGPRGHDRMGELRHELLPRRLSVWQKAVESVNVQVATGPRTGLWVPEAELLVTAKQPWRLYAHLYNWLAVRNKVYFRLVQECRFEPPAPTTWRHLLDTFPPLTAEEKRKAEERISASAKKKGPNPNNAHGKQLEERANALAFWTQLLGQPFPDRAPAPAEVSFRGVSITAEALERNPRLDMVTRAIRLAAWELSEVAFRVELYELDRRLTGRQSEDDTAQRDTRDLLEGFVGDGGFAIPVIAPGDARGFRAADARTRSKSLDMFRRLILRWPGHPPHFDKLELRATSSQTLDRFEGEAATYYCQEFFKRFSRVPVIPREHERAD